jgi:hypothetical protein
MPIFIEPAFCDLLHRPALLRRHPP